MRKRHILRVAALFFGILAVLTSLSRSIYRRLMPIVTPPPDQIAEMRLSADSPYCPMLVTNGAFDGDTLYLLKSRIGAWGQVEYYAKEARVIRGTGDGRFTSVLSGLDYGDMLITSWSKPIRDGAPVLPSSYE